MPELESPVIAIVGHPPMLPEVPEPPPPPPPPPPKALLGTGVVELQEPVEFGDKDPALTEEAGAVLDEVALILQDNPWITKLSVEVHTDRNGSGGANRKLSRNRAKAVVAYLVAQGIDEARLEPRGWGESKPLSEEEGAEADAVNRRVDLIVLEGEPPAKEAASEGAREDAP